MRLSIGLAVLCGALLMARWLPAQHTAIDAAAEALGANGISTLEFTASGAALPVSPDPSANSLPVAPCGTHHSLAIAMSDHIVLVDTSNGEARASSVIAKAKELMPDKPIRYVVAMQHHWDHLDGIRTAIDEGATIVAHESNRAFLERTATAPHTIAPDRLSKSKRPLRLQTVGADGTLADGARVVKLYTMTGFDHTVDVLLVYLPTEKLLAEADAYTPPETPTTPRHCTTTSDA